MNQLKPEECSRAPLQTQDLLQRAEEILTNADKIGCRKYLSPSALVSGNPKLNLAFVAHLFNTWPGLDPLEENEKVDIEDFDAEGEREARVFTLWLNSLDVDPRRLAVRGPQGRKRAAAGVRQGYSRICQLEVC